MNGCNKDGGTIRERLLSSGRPWAGFPGSKDTVKLWTDSDGA